MLEVDVGSGGYAGRRSPRRHGRTTRWDGEGFCLGWQMPVDCKSRQ